MPIIFFKLFNSFFMNGFQNPKDEKSYWILSYLAVIFCCVGFFDISKGHLLINAYQEGNIKDLIINTVFYISFFSIFSAFPILMHYYFNFLMKNSFTYWYIKYIWRKERINIMNIISELPPEIISPHEISFLSNTNNLLEETQISIIRKVWGRNLNYLSKYNKNSI